MRGLASLFRSLPLPAWLHRPASRGPPAAPRSALHASGCFTLVLVYAQASSLSAPFACAEAPVARSSSLVHFLAGPLSCLAVLLYLFEPAEGIFVLARLDHGPAGAARQASMSFFCVLLGCFEE